MEINRKELKTKLELVIQKLMNLDGPENEAELKEKGVSAGYLKRDFGISEWDWPQGIGLYGLIKKMDIDGSKKQLGFLRNWFDKNMEQGLPSRNINTTTPLLTLTELCSMFPAEQNGHG